MTRTTLCLITAGALAVSSVGVMAIRAAVMGDEALRPAGPGTWRVTLTLKGTSEGNARAWVPTPLHLERQHLLEERFSSPQLTARAPDERSPSRRRVAWVGRGGAGEPFHAQAEYLVALRPEKGAAPSRTEAALRAPPRPGEQLGDEPNIEASHTSVSQQALALTRDAKGSTGQLDTAQALFKFVEEKVRNAPAMGDATARQCLEALRGDRAGKARLLAALLRNRAIPARVVQGLVLGKRADPPVHTWVEAFVYDHWMPMCPWNRHFGKLPRTYLVLGHGDKPVVSARRVKDSAWSFRAETLEPTQAAESAWKRAFKAASLYQLPPTDRRLVEVLLLLPLAALVICVFRNLIGLTSFGLFTPALIGLAFRDVNSLPGLGVFILILLVGWGMRRVLDGYHLLQVPRVAMMLTLIMAVLIAVVAASNYWGATTTRYVSLFPMVILTGMVERFWTQETEDGALASFKTLAQTILMAMAIALVLGYPWVPRHMLAYPETLGLVMAGQLLIGLYTGYRLTELWRFRDFLRDEEEEPVGYTTA